VLFKSIVESYDTRDAQDRRPAATSYGDLLARIRADEVEALLESLTRSFQSATD